MSADQLNTARAAYGHVPVPVCCRSPPRRPGTAGWRDILALSEDADAIIERVGSCLEYRDPEGWRFPPAPRTTLPVDKQELHQRRGRRPPPYGPAINGKRLIRRSEL